ncbi:uncharacterized protein [Primulina eburnea]|uniref:uncharacterized protein isoform X1 n=1 Tax=Primulina eburnea TaxID=1245227 RepID=UPI003C6C2CF5
MVVKLIRLWRASISILQEVLLLEKPRNSLLFCFPTDVLDGHLLSRCTFFQDEGSFLQRGIVSKFCSVSGSFTKWSTSPNGVVYCPSQNLQVEPDIKCS